MAISREQAVAVAIDFYASGGGVAVVQSLSELVDVSGNMVFVLARVTYSGEMPEFDVRGPQEGSGWWVAFEELWREGENWEPAHIHPSGGLVRVCEATGAVYQPTLM
jgi:hypothetical protein